VLYYDQGYPDNYIEPELFLADLKKNCSLVQQMHALNIILITVHTRPYRYFFVVQESGGLVQELSWYAIFAVIDTSKESMVLYCLV